MSMALYWGYYCKTCGISSARWTDDPRILRRIYLNAEEKLACLLGDRPLQADTFEVQPLFFLSQHFGHELWVESDMATLVMAEETETASRQATSS